MTNVRLTEDARNFVRCTTCDATILAETECRRPVDANTVCVTCGIAKVDWPSDVGSYFDVVMRRGRLGHLPRPRRSA